MLTMTKRSDHIQISVWYKRRRPTIDMAERPLKLCSLFVLGFYWLLADRSVQQHLRSERNHFHHVSVLGGGVLLARICKHLVAHVYR